MAPAGLTDAAVASANGQAHHNGSVPPSAKAAAAKAKAEDAEFALQADWSRLVPCDDQVYGYNKLGCSDAEWRARVDLAAVYRLCHRAKLNEGINNHLTVMVPGTTDRFLVFPFGLMWSEVTASNLLCVNQDGKVLSGKGEPETTAFYIHAPLHQLHPHGQCVLHTHQPEITALCALDDFKLPMLHQNSQRFYENVAYESYNGMVSAKSEGEHLADVMGSKRVLMHQNHGVMIVAESVSYAWNLLYYLEQNARVTVKALSTGRPLKLIPDEVCAQWQEQFSKVDHEYARLFLEASKRELLRSEDRDFIQ